MISDLVSTDADDGYFEELGEQADGVIEDVAENYDQGYYDDLSEDFYESVSESEVASNIDSYIDNITVDDYISEEFEDFY